LQKSPRTFIEKCLEEILPPINNQCHPGDRDDNLWVTIDNYKPPQTQIEWEQTCFLDKPFHGYYKWPRVIKYSMNKRMRYTQDTMPEQVTILYDRFIDKNFITRFIQLVIFDEENFAEIRFSMFKVNRDHKRKIYITCYHLGSFS
jgi:hypothetical protein